MSMVILGLIIGNAVLLGKSYFVDTEENSDELKNIKSIMKQQMDIIRSSEASDNMDMRDRRNIDHYQGTTPASLDKGVLEDGSGELGDSHLDELDPIPLYPGELNGLEEMEGINFHIDPQHTLVTDLNEQIPEFLFDCLKKKDPWISPCSEERNYLMLFDSQGNILEEKTRDNTKYLGATTNKARIPTGKQIIEIEGHPNFLFQLEGVKRGIFYIG